MSWLTYISLAVIGVAGAVILYLRQQPFEEPVMPENSDADELDADIVGDRFLVLTARELIDTLDLAPSIANIKANLGFSNENWYSDALPLLHNFIVFVQRLPASESHHHAGDGGLVKHTLDVATLALLASAAQSWPPVAKTEDIARLTLVWRYGILTAALLHDIGKTLISFDVRLFDNVNASDSVIWIPDAGNMIDSGRRYYRVLFPDTKTPYDVHASLGWTFFQNIVPAAARRWMNEMDPELIRVLRSYLSGQHNNSPLHDIIRRADMTSTARDLKSGSRQRFSSARRMPLIEIVMETLIEMLGERGAYFSIATTAGGDLFRKGDAVYIMSKTVPDHIRSYLSQHKSDFARWFPSDNQRIFDTLLEYGAVQPSPYDEYKAVTNVAVMFERSDGEVKSHQFTVLQFKLQTLYPHGEYPHEFQGKLTLLSTPTKTRTQSTEHESDAATESGKSESGAADETATTTHTSTSFMASIDDIVIPPPPKARKPQVQAATPVADDIDSLLNKYDLLAKPTTTETAIKAPATAPREIENKPSVPTADRPVPSPGQSKKKLSLLHDLFNDQHLTKDVRYLDESDGAGVGIKELEAERQCQPTSSPRPVCIKPQETLLEAELGTVLNPTETGIQAAVMVNNNDSSSAETRPKPQIPVPDEAQNQKRLKQDQGRRFWNWLANGLVDGSITVNQSSSMIHFVEQGMLMVTPAIFREYAGGMFNKSDPDCPGLRTQQGFVSLGIHERTSRSALYMAMSNQEPPRLLFHCYLVPERHLHWIVRADTRPANNIGLTLNEQPSFAYNHRKHS